MDRRRVRAGLPPPPLSLQFLFSVSRKGIKSRKIKYVRVACPRLAAQNVRYYGAISNDSRSFLQHAVWRATIQVFKLN